MGEARINFFQREKKGSSNKGLTKANVYGEAGRQQEGGLQCRMCRTIGKYALEALWEEQKTRIKS